MEETYKQPLLGFETAFHSLLHRNQLPGQNQNLPSSSNESTSVSSLSQGPTSVVSPTTFPPMMLHHSTHKGSDSTITVSSPTTFFEETENGPCQVTIPALSQRTAPQSTSNSCTRSSASVLTQQSVNGTDLQMACTCANLGRFSESHNNDRLTEGSNCATQELRSTAVTDPSLINTQVKADITMQSNLPTNHTISAVSSHNSLIDTQVTGGMMLQQNQTNSQTISVGIPQVDSQVDNIEIIFYPPAEDIQQMQMNSSANSLDFNRNTSLSPVLGTAVNNTDNLSHDIDENILSQNPTIHHILNNEPISNILDQFEDRIEESNTLRMKKNLLEKVKDKHHFTSIVKPYKRKYSKPEYSKDKSYCGLNFLRTCACSDSEDREEVPDDQVFVVQGQMYRLQEATVIKIGHLQMHAFLRNGSLYVPMCMLWHLLDIDSQKRLKRAMLKHKGIKCEELLENDRQLIKQKYNLSLKNPRQKMIDVVGVRALAKSIVKEHDNDILKTLAYQPFKVKVCSSEMKCVQCGGTVSKPSNLDDYVTLDLSSFQAEDDNCTQDFLNGKSCENTFEQVNVTIGKLYLHKTKFVAFELKNKIYISVKEFVAYKILPLEKLRNKLEKLQYRPITAPPELENIFLQSDTHVYKSLWMSLEKVIAVCKTSYSEDSKRHDVLLHFTLQSFSYEASIQIVASDTSMIEGSSSVSEVKVENTSVRNQSFQISGDAQSMGNSGSNVLLEQYESTCTLQDLQNRCQEGKSLQQTEKNPYLNQDNVTLPEALSADKYQSPNTEENNANEDIAGKGKYETNTNIENTHTDTEEKIDKVTIEIVENEVVLNNDSEYVKESSHVQQDSSAACQDKYDIDIDKSALITGEEYIVQDIELFQKDVLAGKVKCCLKNDPNVVNIVRYLDLHLTKAVESEITKYSKQSDVGRETFKKDKNQNEILRENNENKDMTDTRKHMTDNSTKKQQNQSDKENCIKQGKQLVLNEIDISTNIGFAKNVTCIQQDLSTVWSGRTNDDTGQSVLLNGEENIVQDNDFFKNAGLAGQIKSGSRSDANTVNMERYSDPHLKLVGLGERTKYSENELSQQERAVHVNSVTSDTNIVHSPEQNLSNDGKHDGVSGNKSPVKRDNTQQASFETKSVNHTESKTSTSPVKSPASRVEKICSKIASMMVPNSTNDSVSPLNMLATIATTEEIESDLEGDTGNNVSGNIVNYVSEQLEYSEKEKSDVEEKIKQFIVFAPHGKHLVFKRFKEGAVHAFPALFSPYPDHPMAKDARREFIAAVSHWVNAKFSGSKQSSENAEKALPDGPLDITNKFSQTTSKKDLTREDIEVKSRHSDSIGKDNHQNYMVEQLETVSCGVKGNKVSKVCVDQTRVGSSGVVARPNGLTNDQNDVTYSLSKIDGVVFNKVSDDTTVTKDDHNSTDLEGNTADTPDDSTGLEDKSMESESILADCSSVSLSSCNTSVVRAAKCEIPATESESYESQCESCESQCESSQTERGRLISKCQSSATKCESSKSEFESCSTECDSSQTECESCASKCETSDTNSECSKTRYERHITDCGISGSVINTGITEYETTSVKQSSKEIRRKVKKSNCKEIVKREIIRCKTDTTKDESGHHSTRKTLTEDNVSDEKRSFSRKRRRKFDENENIRKEKRGSKRLSSRNEKEASGKSNKDTNDVVSDTNVSELECETNADVEFSTENTMDETLVKSEPSYKIQVKLKTVQSKHRNQNGAFTRSSRLKHSKTKIKEGNDKKSATNLLHIKKIPKKRNKIAKQKDTVLMKSSVANNETCGNELEHVEQISSFSVMPRSKTNTRSKLSTFKPNRVGKRKLNEASSELRNETTETDVETKSADKAGSTHVMQVATDNIGNETSKKGSCEIETEFKTSQHIQNKSPSTALTDNSRLRKTRIESHPNHKQKSVTCSSKQIPKKENKNIELRKSVIKQSATQTALCSNTERFVVDKECSKLVSSSDVKLTSKIGEKSMKRKALADLCYVKLKRIKFLDDVFKK